MKHKIARKQGFCRFVEHSEIVVAVCCRPCLQHKASRAEIEFHRAVNEQLRLNDAYRIDQLATHDAAERIDIKWSACSQCPRQVFMTDKLCSIPHEGGVAEDVIGMAMRVDDVTDRLVGIGANGREQLQSLANAAPGVDDRDSIVADDE